MARLAAAAVALVVLSGCQVTVALGIDLEADGSGEVRTVVTLDRAAAARAPDLQLRTDDLEEAGWTVEGPDPGENGSVVITARKPFRSVEEAGQVVDEVSGEGGPFADFRLTRDSSFLRTRTSFSGTVDLTSGLEAFSDDDLGARLGSPLGVDRTQLDVANRAFQIRVQVNLPGEVAGNAPVVADNGALWRPQLGERAALRASSEAWNLSRIAFAAVALLGALALAILAVRHLRRRGHQPPA